MFVEIFVIVNWVGTGGYSETAGGFQGFQPLSYSIMAIKMTLSISSVSFGLISLAGILLLILFQKNTERALHSRVIRFLKEFSCPIVLFVLIVGPQFVLYARSGFYERYLLPLVMGYSIFLLFLIRFLRINNARYFLKLPGRNKRGFFLSIACIVIAFVLISVGGALLHSSQIRTILYLALGKTIPVRVADILKPGMLAVLGGVVFFGGAWTLIKKRDRRLTTAGIIYFFTVAAILYKMTYFAGVYEFTLVGRQIDSLLYSVGKNTQPADSILIVSDSVRDYEAASSVKVYLNNLARREKIYSYAVLSGDNFEENILVRIENKDVPNYIVIFYGLEQQFFSASRGWFNTADFVREDKGIFVVYYRKAGVHIASTIFSVNGFAISPETDHPRRCFPV
jgi:hypothetical protein